MKPASQSDNLRASQRNKKDEFYTLYRDIEAEVEHYRTYFSGKTVYCNCDGSDSNFVRYFKDNFHALKLRKLYATCYRPAGLFQAAGGRGAMVVFDGNTSAISELKGNGDFRNPESVAILKRADIVVTNPPFSLFREFVAQLTEYDKKFLIIGHQAAASTKHMFLLLKAGRVSISYGFPSGAGFFRSIYNFDGENYARNRGHNAAGTFRVPGVVWYTNLTDVQHPPLKMEKSYSAAAYPRYDNYNAIHVDRLKNIPRNYPGVMGVPVTIFRKLNREQFTVLALTQDGFRNPGLRHPGARTGKAMLNGKQKFPRVLIQRRNPAGPVQ